MASSLIDRARGRVVMHLDRITGFLDDHNARRAFNESVRALQAEAAGLRRERCGDGDITYAELAGVLLANAALLHAHHPRRPAGCPAVPRPADLRAVFTASYEGALQQAAAGVDIEGAIR
jgi:hypothetical protein